MLSLSIFSYTLSIFQSNALAILLQNLHILSTVFTLLFWVADKNVNIALYQSADILEKRQKKLNLSVSAAAHYWAL